MLISIQIKSGNTLRADICGENCVCLYYENSYIPGDVISFQCTEPGYYQPFLEHSQRCGYQQLHLHLGYGR